jgi:hypothetical protein
MKRIALLAVAGFLAGVLPACNNAVAFTLGFYCITNNDPANAAIGESQFFVDVTGSGPGSVAFTFRNTGPDASTIAQVYFDTDLISSISGFACPLGVSFSQGASPGNLPGGNSIVPPFETTPGLLAGAAHPAPHWGVNHYEQMTVFCLLRDGVSFSDIQTAAGNGDLRIGIHGISMGDNAGSESFVNTPEPATLLIMVPGLMALRAARRRN